MNIINYVGETMSEKEFKSKCMQLSIPTSGMLEEVKKLSNMELVFKIISKRSIAFDASIRIGRGLLNKHCITINLAKSISNIELDYLIAHELQHALRMLNSAPEYRVGYCQNRSNVENFIKNIKKPNAAIKDMLPTFVSNLGLVSFNTPVDSEIERTLYSEYPALREAQYKYLQGYKDMMIESLTNKNVNSFVPKEITVPLNILNCAYLKSIAHIIGDAPYLRYKSYGFIYKKAEKVCEILMEKDMGQKSDVEKVKRISEYLNINNLLQTVDFELSSTMYND